MITTGIIKEINLSSKNHTANKYRIELGIFKQPGSTDIDVYTVEANACVPGGINASYAVGDRVYVSFLHDDISYPVILGHIYQGLSEEARSYAKFDSIDVINDVNLPKATMIGDISYNELAGLIKRNKTRDQAESEGIISGVNLVDLASKDYVNQLINEKIEVVLNTEV